MKLTAAPALEMVGQEPLEDYVSRVLVIATTDVASTKGSSLRVNSIVRTLSTTQRITLISYRSSSELGRSGVQSVAPCGGTLLLPRSVSKVSAKKILLDVLVFLRAFVISTKEPFSAIHCEDFEAAVVGWTLSWLSPGSKLVYDLHNRIVDNLALARAPRFLEPLARRIERMVLRRCDAVILNWESYAGDAALPAQQITVLDKVSTDREYTWVPASRFWVYAGNFMWYQGVLQFLESMARVRPTYELLLIGPRNEQVREAVQRLRLEARVHLVGSLSVEKVNYALSRAEAAIAPRVSGRQPSMKIVHYLSQGTPVIATDIPANREMLRDGDNALLYRDDHELVRVLDGLSTDPSQLAALRAGADRTMQRILELWDDERLLRFYSNVLAS